MALGEEQQKAFDELKYNLTHAPTLACPDFTKPFVLQPGASDDRLGAMLTQTMDERVRVIEKACLVVKWGIWKMRGYLKGYHFTVITDHQSFKWPLDVLPDGP